MRYIIIISILQLCVRVAAQPPPVTIRQEQQLETLAEREETMLEEDTYLEQLEVFRRHPIHLNTASPEELQLLQLLSAMQVHALIQYRALLGKIIHVYELQAIPHWDIATIQKILPYVTIRDVVTISSRIPRLKDGSASLLLRISRPVQRPADFADTGSKRIQGSVEKILVRYRYTYKNLLQFGVLGEKDGGEPVVLKKRRYGFDFYSFHFFARKLGIIQSLAIGDFTVNMGQGLIQWQGLSFGKGELTAVKRQSAVLRPYSSAGEFNFHRGVGVQLGGKRIQFAAFCSFRKLDANMGADDKGNATISSFLVTGLHRTENELAERNNIYQQVIGSTVSYEGSGWHLGGNVVQYRFSHPVQKRDEPYNLFSFRGKQLLAYSIHYDYTFRNLHLFGELAADRSLNKAMVNGLLLSMDRKIDISVLMRHLEPGFQSLNASAFTESSVPSNESGIYIGLGCRPFPKLRLDAYADFFQFPWLKFRTDAPATGREFQIQLAWQPRKRIEVVSRFRTRVALSNHTVPGVPVHLILPIPRTNWRTHVSWQPGPAWQLSQRVEMVWYGGGAGNGHADSPSPRSEGGNAAPTVYLNPTFSGVRRDQDPKNREQGYLLYTDLRYSPPNRPYSFGGRMQLFETDGFNSRIYAFEQDVPTAVTAVYHKGIRYYFTARVEITRLLSRAASARLPNMDLWARWAGGWAEMQDETAFQPNSGNWKIQVVFSWD